MQDSLHNDLREARESVCLQGGDWEPRRVGEGAEWGWEGHSLLPTPFERIKVLPLNNQIKVDLILSFLYPVFGNFLWVLENWELR